MIRRRNFLKTLLSTSIGAFFVSAFYPVFRYLIPPAGAEPATLSTVAAKSADLKPNSGRVFRFGTRPGIVIRKPDGELKAFSATCTHLQCTVQYRDDLQNIYCACHGGRFDLNGVPIAGPPPRPLTEYTVNENHGDIVVSKG